MFALARLAHPADENEIYPVNRLNSFERVCETAKRDADRRQEFTRWSDEPGRHVEWVAYATTGVVPSPRRGLPDSHSYTAAHHVGPLNSSPG